ncbi:MAG TPA: ABC transporter permease, partial [Crenotrichaceae bacterium]|nr:ABC transporter permease [Crenotrichaceae bacterium]
MVKAIHWSLLKTSVRFFIKHPWQLWLTILSIALGSAVMIAVDIANESAKQSFADSVDKLSGQATHYLISSTDQGFKETLYTQLRIEWGYRDIAPVVEGKLAIKGLQYQLIGIDPFALSLLLSQQSHALNKQSWFDLLTRKNAALITGHTADLLNLSPRSKLKIRVNTIQKELAITGILNNPEQSVYDNLLITDIASAQDLLNKYGKLDRIALTLNPQQATKLSQLIPGSVRLIPSSTRSHTLEQMTAAFRTNLTAMSLLAMLVGCFLVYNTMTFSVLQRRQQFAIERMLGITGQQIFMQMLTEALLLAVLGGVSGIVLGIVLSKYLLSLVTRTIHDVYAEITTSLLHIEPVFLIKGLGLTMIAVLLATLAPAIEAARISPVSVHRVSGLEQRNQRIMPMLMFAGLLLIAFSFLLLYLFSRHLVAGFGALFILVIGYSLMMPGLIKLLLQLLGRLFAFPSTIFKLALRGISSSLSRTSLAITALAIAVSTTVGVGIMTTSFRHTLAEWLDITLQNDLYISSTNADGSKVEGNLETFWLTEVNKLSGISAISTGKTSQLQINNQSIALLVLNPGQSKSKGFHLLDGDSSRQWQRYLNGEVALISEPYAYHQQLSVGDHFQALNNEGTTVDIEVGAIFQDYSSSQGMIVVHR